MIRTTVSFFQDPHLREYQGTWRQYIILKVKDVIPFPAGVKPEQAFNSFVNPVTVFCILDYAKTKGHKAIIHSAAASNLGKMLIRQAKIAGVTIINIVRRHEQVKILEDEGADIILDSSTSTFTSDLKEIASKYEATGYFDPI